MASGKTRFGKRLAAAIDYDFVDLDHLFEEMHGLSPAAFIRKFGENLFRHEESLVLQENLPDSESIVIACGGGTPCFHNNIQWMKEEGKVVWLNIPEEMLFQRLTKQKGDRPMIPQTDGKPDHEKFLKHYKEREKFYAQADFSFTEAKVEAVLAVLDVYLKS